MPEMVCRTGPEDLHQAVGVGVRTCAWFEIAFAACYREQQGLRQVMGRGRALEAVFVGKLHRGFGLYRR